MGSRSPGLARPPTHTDTHAPRGRAWARIPLYELGLWVCEPSKHQIKRQKRKCCRRAHQGWQRGVPTDKKEKETPTINRHRNSAGMALRNRVAWARSAQRPEDSSGSSARGLGGPSAAREPEAMASCQQTNAHFRKIHIKRLKLSYMP